MQIAGGQAGPSFTRLFGAGQLALEATDLIDGAKSFGFLAPLALISRGKGRIECDGARRRQQMQFESHPTFEMEGMLVEGGVAGARENEDGLPRQSGPVFAVLVDGAPKGGEAGLGRLIGQHRKDGAVDQEGEGRVAVSMDGLRPRLLDECGCSPGQGVKRKDSELAARGNGDDRFDKRLGVFRARHLDGDQLLDRGGKGVAQERPFGRRIRKAAGGRV